MPILMMIIASIAAFFVIEPEAHAFAICQSHTFTPGPKLEVANPIRQELVKLLPLPPNLKVEASTKKLYAQLTLKFN